MTVVVASAMLPAQENAWRGLLEIYARLSDGWCLVGGQLVHLHCWERGHAPNRPTNDADAALDVRARPRSTARQLRLPASGANDAGLPRARISPWRKLFMR